MDLARELPLLDSSVLEESQLAGTRAIIRELRDICDLERYKTRIEMERKGIVDETTPTVRTRLAAIIATLKAQPPSHVPHAVDQIHKTELLLHVGLGLPLPICWHILDMTEYWMQIKYNDDDRIRVRGQQLPELMTLRAVIPENLVSFKRLRKVVLAIGGHNTLTREALCDLNWSSIEIQTGGNLPSRHVTHSFGPQPYWEQDVPDVHLLQWSYNGTAGKEDDDEVRRILGSLRPNDSLEITVTAPSHRSWMEHIVLLHVEPYYSCV
ncbi:hypothetical protein DAEQUDRAFT_814362 [Daedalea quercina L-15889]|uniref:Uncharacterized protein n=1 Tax=Daedalea quercina L-15889 TaxID=1314783 RepID=A0A165M6L3_9APHY|nr:hypothetical protein DAEQUDRAFT_814362 [Daedalea quercina L-15889]